MQKTYKCKNGHKFKIEEGKKNVICPTCNAYAEPIHWNTVGEFPKIPFGFKDELGFLVKTLRGK